MKDKVFSHLFAFPKIIYKNS